MNLLQGTQRVKTSSSSIRGEYASFDWPSSACRSDFDCDGQVGGYDYDIFLAHLGHSCQPTAVERVTWGAIKTVYR